MPSVAEPKRVTVKARAAFAAPNWSCEAGQEIEVLLPDARRMIARGLAEEVKTAPLPKATPEEVAAAAIVNVGKTAKKGRAPLAVPARVEDDDED